MSTPTTAGVTCARRSAALARRDVATPVGGAVPLLLTYGQAARLLGVSERLIGALVREGKLPVVTVEGYVRPRIARDHLEGFVARLRRVPESAPGEIRSL